MPDLFSKSALSGRAPVTLAGVTLSEAALGSITSVAVFPGQLAKVTKRLGGFPPPNRSLPAPLRIWTGPEQIFLIGADAPDLSGLAAVTDQTGGWAALQMQGSGVETALMRLYPLDLRAKTFATGQVARAPLGHMQSVLLRTGSEGFLILVFRSMARTAWAEIAETLQKCAARMQANP